MALLVVAQVAILLTCASDGRWRPSLWEDRYQYNFRWASPAGIDLSSEVAIQARSYVETAFLIGAGLEDVVLAGDRMGVVPYYSSHYGTSSLSRSLSLRFDDRAADPHWTIRGTVYASLERVEFFAAPPPVGAIPWLLNVRICVWGTGLAYGNKAGEFYTGRYAALRSGGLWLSFGLPAGGSAEPDSRVSGPARYPTHSYFGDWISVGSSRDTPDVQRGSGPEHCRLPTEFPAAVDPGEYVEKPSVQVPPPEIRPPYPGWPAGAQR
ncbi:hypothetical protein [Nocardia sp. MW-W600-9]